MEKIDIRKIKENLRAEFKNLRKNMKPEEKSRKDCDILEKVLKLPEYQAASTILTYVSTEIEVDTKALIEQALQDGKTVAVPRCTPGKIDMKFYVIDSFNRLTAGAFGVLEPSPAQCVELRDFKGSVCVLPGLGFDLQGFRLGYGKGYYDRFLSKYTGKNIGVCYNVCLKTLLPHGRYDKMINILVTEKFVKRFRAQ